MLAPVAAKLERVHPNTVTVFALLTGLGAGLSYWLSHRHMLFFALGGLLVAISGLADGLDGVMARLHDRTSARGDFMDHFFDRLVNIAILAGLALSPGATLSLGLAVTIGVLLNSYLGTQIEASFGKRDYTGLGKAQLFIALVAGSLVLGFLPDPMVTICQRDVALVDIFFVLVGLSAIQAMIYRYRLAMRLAAESDK